MRIASWNVNSIRARRERVLAWLDYHQPDVVLLQETKCDNETFETAWFEELGYEAEHWGVDHWNGVAILSRVGLAGVQRGFPGHQRSPYDEARLLSATISGVRVHSVYVPNGRELGDPHYLFKLVWLERLRAAIDVGQPTIVAGDFNVAPADADIYDPKRWRRRTHASPPERAAIESLLDLGLIDVTRQHQPEPGVFTWWSYRPGQFEQNRGLRIDLALCTPDVADQVDRVWIDTDERAGKGPSDHAPLVVDLEP
ncbi:MAG: exodeoxyribonuclease III [Actinomycetia bacterium]|nr:exodeoxyribonuclease III [Actinomycetes bacterium]MCP4224923.1 exodeoxyribonuclease III [Actinomycetes bacterium]MCP5031731.1 exodeoxyribonuclease III [Actinomycetes bacterium]